MLLEFRVENHRSLRDEQVLSMEAARIGDALDAGHQLLTIQDIRLLPAVALYGANASGKSNVLSAFGFLRDAVLDSHATWPPQGGVPRDAFAWGRASEPSLFEVTFIVNEVRFQYGFSVDQARVLEEWLFAWPRGRRQTWFERDENTFNFGEKLKGENRTIEQVTRPNALFLSTAAQHQHAQLVPIYNWFQKIRTRRVLGYKERYADAMPAALAAAVFAAAAATAAATSDNSDDLIRIRDVLPVKGQENTGAVLQSWNTDLIDKLRQLLIAADMGVTDFAVDRRDTVGHGTPNEKQQKIRVRHEFFEGGGWLPLEQESAGTKALFHLGPPVIETLEDGGLLVVDELEAGLHPFVAMRLIDLFNGAETNPNNAQILFTTHDTNLLAATVGDATLRRDQIWLTEKNKEGATKLYPLTDYKPRKEENLERGYLQGRFGGIPFLGSLTGSGAME